MSSPSGRAATQSPASTASRAASSSSSVASWSTREREVLPQRADEDVVLLGHQRDVAAQVGERQLGQPDAADRRPSRSAAGGCRRAAGRASTCPAPDGPTIASRSPTPRDRSTPCRTSRPSTYENRTSSASICSPGGHPPGGDPVVGHVRDAEQPGQRRRADLQLVEDRDDPVDRVDQHLHVERRRGDVAERRRRRGCRASRRTAASPRSAAGRTSPRRSGRTGCGGRACTARRRTTPRCRGRPARSGPRRARAPRRCGRPRRSR